MNNTSNISARDISKHNTTADCWIVIDGQIWDVTQFLPEHPGGAALILKYAGRDATKAYSEIHSPTVLRDSLPPTSFKGTLDTSTIDEEWLKPPSSESTTVVLDHERPPLHTIINSYDFEEVAQRTAAKKTWTFYSTGAMDCVTKDMNQAMYRRVWFRPRVLRNVRDVDTSTTVLGQRIGFPLFICPTGLAKMINSEAEMALARGAKSTNILQMVSTAASVPLKDIMAQAPDHPFLFQLYVNKDRQKTEQLLREVKSLGFKAIFVTVDAAARGKRESDERVKADESLTNPVTGEHAINDKRGGGLTRVMGSYIDPSLSWDDIAWLRQWTDLPIVLKGVMTAEDARMAMQYGLDGILLSNHGGRNLDHSPPSILLLLEMRKNCPEVFEKMPVFVDGGIRRGGDILKALCLGATAVGIGRTFLYALAYGTEGVEHLVEILRDEMEAVMRLVGITDLSQAHPGLVNTLDVDHLIPSSISVPDYGRQSETMRVPRPRI